MPQSLRSADIAEIRRITEIMHAEFGEVRVEWLRTEDGLISLWDLSVEAGRPLPRKMDGVVSIGTARGRAVLVSNTDPLEELLSDRSVIPDASFYTAHRGTAATELRAALFADRPADAMSKPIVVTPFPKISLALLLDHVAGFVFDEAATLCHLAIILREAGVPAVVSPGATYAITPGQIIEITDGGWHAVSAS